MRRRGCPLLGHHPIAGTGFLGDSDLNPERKFEMSKLSRLFAVPILALVSPLAQPAAVDNAETSPAATAAPEERVINVGPFATREEAEDQADIVEQTYGYLTEVFSLGRNWWYVRVLVQ
jgi:hypothetical protein